MHYIYFKAFKSADWTLYFCAQNATEAVRKARDLVELEYEVQILEKEQLYAG